MDKPISSPREVILQCLYNSEKQVSGEILAKTLGMSRTAVWKHVKQLQDQGYSISSQEGSGYKLEDRDIIIPSLVMDMAGKMENITGLEHFLTLDSTNDHLKEALSPAKRSFINSGTVVVTEVQTGGKGRLGKTWCSPKGGLWFSILLRPDVHPSQLSPMTLVSGLAVVKVLASKGIDARLKWPNDILVNKKKICGILTELTGDMDNINNLIIGIGLNVNNKPDDLSQELQENTTSMIIQAGNRIDRNQLLADILKSIDRHINRYLLEGFKAFRDQWMEHALYLNETIQVNMPGESITGKFIDITEDGCLVLEHEGEKKLIRSGIVEYVR